MKKSLLDTNAYTRLLTGDEKVLIALGKAETTFISVIVIGELLSGFRGGTKETKNKDLLERFLQKPTVKILNITTETAEIFSELYDGLKKAGTPLPVNDIWLAATGVETGSVLITYDEHFKK